MRILISGDLHCWYESPGPADARIEEWHRCAAALLDAATAHACELALFPGDFFTSNRPSAAQVLAVIHLFQRFEEHGIRVLGIAGNHDVGAPDAPNFVTIFGAWQDRWGITSPRVIEFPLATVACFPWIKHVTDDHLSAILHGLVAQMPEGRPRIVLAHYATDASTYSSGETPVGREPVLRLAELETLPVDLVVLGHIHRPHIWLGERPHTQSRSLILHPGALLRRDFGEERDDRLFFIYDSGERVISQFELPARRFLTVDALNPPVLRQDIAEAYVRITYKATEEEASRIDHADLIRLVQSDGAFHVAGVFPEIIRAERGRAEGLTETTDPQKALDAWLALHTDLSEELRARIGQAAAELLQELSA